MTAFQAISIMLGITALSGYINHRFIKMSSTIGLMAIGIALSLLTILAGETGVIDTTEISVFIKSFNFGDLLLHSMLGFLLFAGALHVNLDDLKSQKMPIFTMATAGVLLSTLIAGSLIYLVSGLIGVDMPFIWALVFGALISPTDPIAVMGALKSANAPKSLETKITGESLFNDGTGVVVYLTLLGIAVSGQAPSAGHVIGEFLFEAVGGVIFGGVIGYSVFKMLQTIDDYSVEVMLTLALVSLGYATAEMIHVSAPIAIVVAGLIIGNHGRSLAMSEKTKEHVDTFWKLIDEILNAILFIMIGLVLATIEFDSTYALFGLAAAVIVLLARFISVWIPIAVMSKFQTFTPGSVKILTWGGLRGGISVALALALPANEYRDPILFATYMIVILSILIQGLTLEKVIKGTTK